MDKTSSMYLYVKLNWDANRYLPAESNDCMNSASYEYRNMSARRGAQLNLSFLKMLLSGGISVSQTPVFIYFLNTNLYN